jgi:hypothetical protein
MGIRSSRICWATASSPSHPLISEDVNIDFHLAPADLLHVVDADSSQTLAIHEARHGTNLVISKQTLSRELRALELHKLSARPRHYIQKNHVLGQLRAPHQP